MALSPLTNVPIAWQNSLVDVHPTSLYGADHDMALVSTVMQLQAPSGEEVVFVLPTEDDPVEAPVMRVIDEDQVGDREEFEPTTFEGVEEELAEAFREAEEADQKLWKLVKEHSKGAMIARVRIGKDDQLVRFSYRIKVPRMADRTFELRVLAPLASFVIATGGTISFAVGLPRLPDRGITVDEAAVENPPGTAIEQMTERPMLGQRQFVGHWLRNDPLYRVRYTYA